MSLPASVDGRRLRAGAVELWVEQHGSGAPLLLIAGLGYASRCWHELRRDLRDTGATTAFDQRGAFIAKPSIEQARDVFEARRLIEPAVLRRLIDTHTPEKIARLRQHQELESDARRRNDKRAVIRLSGEFHTLAAELAGNSALARSMRELCILTCLTIFLYDAPTANSCRNDEHALIIDAVAKRDRARAEKLMLDHLDHIESSLKLDNTNGEVDLEAIFKKFPQMGFDTEIGCHPGENDLINALLAQLHDQIVGLRTIEFVG